MHIHVCNYYINININQWDYFVFHDIIQPYLSICIIIAVIGLIKYRNPVDILHISSWCHLSCLDLDGHILDGFRWTVRWIVLDSM